MAKMSCCCFGCPDKAERIFMDRRATSTGASIKSCNFAAAANNLTRIFEELKCPVCFNVCVPPIHNCVNGHIICDNCRHRGNVTLCPTCRESLQGARNYFAENFIVNYAQQCRYASQGCEHLQLKGCNMKPHEQKCIFRPVKCIVDNCGLDIPYKNLLTHLDFAHKTSGTKRLPASVQFNYCPRRNTKKTKWLPFYIQAFGNNYYVMMERVRKNYWIWAYSQTAKEADELEFNQFVYIKLKHPEKKITHSWHGPVYPVRTPFKTIMAEGCCFMLPEMIMKNFVSDKVINLTVDIRKRPRKNLKDVKIEESDTAVASSLPAEYNRPPSFYEPNRQIVAPALPEAPAQEPHAFNHNNLTRDMNSNNPPTCPKATPKYPDISRPRLRTAAIGIPGGINFSPGTTTSSLSSIPTVSILEIPPAEMTLKNDDDLQDKMFSDKVASQSSIAK